jgi:hypothetical protein
VRVEKFQIGVVQDVDGPEVGLLLVDQEGKGHDSNE